MSETPTSANIRHDPDNCGRELGDNSTCGLPAVIWTILDGDEWRDTVATACAEHRDELLAFPGIRVSSDAPICEGDVPL